MPSIQDMKKALDLSCRFYLEFISMNEARRALAGGGGYPSERRARFDAAWDRLESLLPEMDKLLTTYKEGGRE